MMSDGSGQTLPGSLLTWDRATCSWRTSPDLFGTASPHVLSDLAELGFNAEWGCLAASAVGAPHRRDGPPEADLNPSFVEALMGLPDGWSDPEGSVSGFTRWATDWSHKLGRAPYGN